MLANGAAATHDTTQLMASWRQSMAESERLHKTLVNGCHGRDLAREVDESLLDLAAMKTLMLPACSDEFPHPVRKLAKLSVMFLQTAHYKKAVELGWNRQDFWGVGRYDIRDAKPRGLLPTLAWSRFKGKLRGIDRDGAKIAVLRRDGMVSSMQMWRPHPCPGTVPFWLCEGLGAEL